MVKQFIKPLLTGLFFYIIVVLHGLISFQPLEIILWRGIYALIIGLFLSLSIKILYRYALNQADKKSEQIQEEEQKYDNNSAISSKYEQNQKNFKEEKNTRENEISQNKRDDGEFSPLDPPVLETENE